MTSTTPVRRRAMRWLLIMVAAVGAALLGAGAAHAAPYEPNDTFAQATGPMVAGQDYKGVIETNNDVDYFYFNVKEQRQIDVSLVRTSCGSSVYAYVLDSDNRDADGASALGSGGSVSHSRFTTPGAAQYVVQVRSSGVGCAYTLRVDPADAVIQQAPGVVVSVGEAVGAEDVQRVYLNDQLVGSVPGASGQTFSLGQLPADARLRFEAENSTGPWSWNVAITNQTDRTRTTVLSEEQAGGSSDDPRVGIVRRVTITPTGGVIDSCGEALAPTTCIPVDGDHDGSPLGQDCNDGDAAIHPGAAEVAGNAVDENCDGVVQTRATSAVVLRRKGKRYIGTVRSSSSGCRANRAVTLRRAGSARSFGRARTSQTGVFTIRHARLKGRVYVTVAAASTTPATCGSTRSTARRL